MVIKIALQFILLVQRDLLIYFMVLDYDGKEGELVLVYQVGVLILNIVFSGFIVQDQDRFKGVDDMELSLKYRWWVFKS